MTVAELIEELQQYDKEKEVYLTSEGQFLPTQANIVSFSLTLGVLVIST
jgi:hypothetical protein